MVLPKYGCVLLVNGCFWHRHECHLFKWPKTRQQFWREKIQSNKARDAAQMEKLLAGGWRVIVVWECAIKGRERLGEQELVDMVVAAICGQTTVTEITGSKSPTASQET
jgi:DNA mismatch endonuclease (patch repair protein)